MRERREDIPLLIDHFLKEFTTSHGKQDHRDHAGGAESLLRQYSWPGNVRELKNTIESMVVIDTDGVLDVDDLTEDLQAATITVPGDGPAGADPASANRSRTSRSTSSPRPSSYPAATARKPPGLLGIGERTLYRKLKEYGSS